MIVVSFAKVLKYHCLLFLFFSEKILFLRYCLSIRKSFEITLIDLKSEGVGEVGKLDHTFEF